MARNKYQNAMVDGMGRVVGSGTVTVYLSGTTTLATVYDGEAGSVISGSQITTDSDGLFSFWVDEGDYAYTQRFKITLAKTGYATQTIDDIQILEVEGIVTPYIKTLLDDTTAAAARTTLGVAIGSDVQPYDALLTAIAALTTSANEMIYSTGSDTVAMTALTSWARTFIANSTDADAVADLGILALNNDWTAGQFSSASTLTDGSVALDYQTDMVATLLLEENSTLGEPSNKSSGDSSSILLFVTQDGTGSRTLSFNAAIDFADHDSAVNTDSGKTTIYLIWTDGTQDYARRIWIEN